MWVSGDPRMAQKSQAFKLLRKKKVYWRREKLFERLRSIETLVSVKFKINSAPASKQSKKSGISTGPWNRTFSQTDKRAF